MAKTGEVGDADDELIDAIILYDETRIGPVQEEILRQRATVPGRYGNMATRAAVLVGAAGVLGGTQLVTQSGNVLWSTASLVLFVLAAVCGLISMRPHVAEEVDIAPLIIGEAHHSETTLLRAIALNNLKALVSETAVLRVRSRWVTAGFVVLLAAWTVAGAGTIASLATPSPAKPTTVEIKGDVHVRNQ